LDVSISGLPTSEFTSRLGYNRSGTSTERPELELKAEGQEYGIITAIGDSVIICDCFDGKTRKCSFKRMCRRRRLLFNIGDIVLMYLSINDEESSYLSSRYIPEHVVEIKELGNDNIIITVP
jgi:hypothetical protein